MINRKDDEVMKKYNVVIPIVGIICIEVDAENEKEALQKGFNSEELTLDNVAEWDAYEKIVEGNCLHVNVNKAYAEEIE